MLNQLLKEQEKNRALLKTQKAEARQQAIWATSRVTRTIDSELNSGLKKIERNNRLLRVQGSKLAKETATFKAQTNLWIKEYEKLQKGLQSLGDVKAWSERINQDIEEINAKLNYRPPRS